MTIVSSSISANNIIAGGGAPLPSHRANLYQLSANLPNCTAACAMAWAVPGNFTPIQPRARVGHLCAGGSALFVNPRNPLGVHVHLVNSVFQNNGQAEDMGGRGEYKRESTKSGAVWTAWDVPVGGELRGTMREMRDWCMCRSAGAQLIQGYH